MFGLLRQGEGKIIITASFEEKMQTVRLPKMETAHAVWDFLEILFEELRCENFYEKGLVEERKVDEAQPASGTPAAQTPTGSSGALKRKSSGDKFGSSISLPSKQQRLSKSSSVDDDLPLAASMKKTASNVLGQQQQQQQQQHQQPQPRPRGRPAGSKNKASSDPSKKSSSRSAIHHPVSPTKRPPIYHNAHKMYGQSQSQHTNLQPPTLRPEVAPTTVVPVAPSPNGGRQQQQNSYKSAGRPNYPKKKSNRDSFSKSNLPSDPDEWSIDQVIGHISMLDPSLEVSVGMFKAHEIDGKALGLLTSEMMMKYMDMKLGPALKICNIVNMIQGKKHMPLLNWDE